jgi:hypothetical protein
MLMDRGNVPCECILEKNVGRNKEGRFDFLSSGFIFHRHLEYSIEDD